MPGGSYAGAFFARGCVCLRLNGGNANVGSSNSSSACRRSETTDDARGKEGHPRLVAGTVFEWYDFYLYGSLAAIIGAQFFSSYPEATRNVFALLAFAAGFLVRPFGALFFGRLGDLVGRKYTFLVTILIMGASTFLVGLLPGYESIGWVAPVILIALRMLQGLALGGEYGGAVVYVAEHAPARPARLLHIWIQTTATLGLLLSLMVILAVRTLRRARPTSPPGAGAFRSCCRSSCSASRSGSGCRWRRARPSRR